jgi:hypothetical protein
MGARAHPAPHDFNLARARRRRIKIGLVREQGKDAAPLPCSSPRLLRCSDLDRCMCSYRPLVQAHRHRWRSAGGGAHGSMRQKSHRSNLLRARQRALVRETASCPFHARTAHALWEERRECREWRLDEAAAYSLLPPLPLPLHLLLAPDWRRPTHGSQRSGTMHIRMKPRRGHALHATPSRAEASWALPERSPGALGASRPMLVLVRTFSASGRRPRVKECGGFLTAVDGTSSPHAPRSLPAPPAQERYL